MKKLITAFLFLFCYSCSIKYTAIPRVKDGHLDLSAWNFERDGTLNLSGTWEFYWKKLYTPADFAGNKTGGSDIFMRVPASWRNETVQGEKLPGMGYSTYHCVIYIPGATGKTLGLKVMDCFSSYTLFVNGRELARNGLVSANSDEMQPQFLPQAIIFTTVADSIEIIVHVANNFTSEGGIWQEIKMGTAKQITDETENIKFSTLFFMGALFILILYHLFIFFLRRTEWSAFWFAVLVAFGLGRTMLVGERFFYQLFPGFPLSLGYRIEYLDFIPLTTLFILFLHHLNRTKVMRKIVNGYVIVTIIECLIVMLTPAHVYTSLLPWFVVMLGAGFVLAFVLMFKYIRQKQRGSQLLFFVSALVIIASVNDVLFSLQVINTFFCAHYVFGLLLLTQAYILASRFANSYSTIETLSSELNLANISLEKKVEERTHELEVEKKKSDDLLLNILPAETANELKQHGRSKAKTYSMVTVMFTDFKDFTDVSEKISAELLVAEIDYCFSTFDHIVQKYGIEKIKTVGDAYLCAAGLPAFTFTHAEDTIKAAIEIRDFMLERKKEKEVKGEIPFEIRIGIHTGPVVAGIVGVKKFAYDIWGDTVNLAARLEQSSEAGKINISGTTYELVKGKFKCTYRGKIEAKNKGEIDMYFLENKV